MENLNTALLLMVVGMTTVFAILLVNKYAPEEVVPDKKGAQGPAAIPGNILAAISAAVTVVTQGKGKVAKVEKVK